mmetsp:Transcript_17094/g.42706  ORF Transcript_17094/g.42706 Transcript_17094/m.42706 type:complete len:177 (-) Transcript_17094:309-839(-)
MALRLTCSKLMRTAAKPSIQRVALRSFGAEAPAMEVGAPAPSIFDKIISLTIVDPSGARRKINGVVGKTLYEACESNEVELGPSSIGGPSEIVHSENWTEPVFGAGPTSGYDHVIVSGPGVATATPMTEHESEMIEDYWDFDEVFPESRLASMITLTKEMNGMIVFVPPRVDDSNP